MGQLEARTLGMAALPLVVIPHPVGTLPLEAIRSLSDSIFEELVRALVLPANNDR